MKKLSQLNEAKNQIEAQEDALNHIEVKDLKEYEKLAYKFLSPESRLVIDYMIDHNDDYVQTLGKGKDANAIETFYNGPVPKDAELKELYKAIGVLAKNNRLLEIPTFQTKEQFEGIMKKDISPDEILLDLNSESGRNSIVKKYDKMVWKIARQFQGKSRLDLDELYSAGLEGLTWAMNGYGKKSKKAQKKEEETGEEIVDIKKYKSYTFSSFAAFMIRNSILEAIKNESHIVRIPVSQQNKERAEKGSNTKDNTISGDQTVGGSDDHSAEKSMFDKIGVDAGLTNDVSDLDREDEDKIWKEIYDKLSKKFDDKTLDIFYSVYGVNGHKEEKAVDVAKRLGMTKSNITYYCFKVFKAIQDDPKLKELFTDAYELMHESIRTYDNNNTTTVYSV